jgi:hypothetical protein
MNPDQLLKELEVSAEQMRFATVAVNDGAVEYWGNAAETSLVMCGLALASLFALLALRKGEGNKPRLTEWPVAFLLTASVLGFLVYAMTADSLHEFLFTAVQLKKGELPPSVQQDLAVQLNVAEGAGSVAFLGLLGAIGLSGFLRSFLLGLLSVAGAFVALIVMLNLSMRIMIWL